MARILWRDLEHLRRRRESRLGDKVFGQRVLALALHLGQHDAQAVLEHADSFAQPLNEVVVGSDLVLQIAHVVALRVSDLSAQIDRRESHHSTHHFDLLKR